MIQFPFEMVPFFAWDIRQFSGEYWFDLFERFVSAQRWIVEHCSTIAVATRAFLLELPRPARHGTLWLSLSSLSLFFCDHVFRVSFLNAHLYGHYALVFLVAAQSKQTYALTHNKWCFRLFFTPVRVVFDEWRSTFLPASSLPIPSIGEEAHLEVQLKKCQAYRTLKRLTKSAQLEGCRLVGFLGMDRPCLFGHGL